nr:serine hydrolase [Micromonospora sp. NBRC 107566]
MAGRPERSVRDVPCPGAVARPASARPHPSPPVPPPAGAGERLRTAGLAVPAGATRPPAVTADSWLVADLDTGAVLGGCGPHEYGRPASVQKLLLVAAVMPRLDPNRVVEVTEADMDFEPGSSAVGLVRGGRYRIDTLWLGLLLNSGNDAANVLARLGGGTAAAGVAGMNAEARRLGAYRTHAATPSGLDGPGQVTTAYDLALIARADFTRPDFRRYVASRQAWIPPQPRLHQAGYGIQNDNQLLYRYRGALGGKTGYTDLARHSFVGAAQRDGRRLLVTLLGADASPQRGWEQGAALLDWGFAQPRSATVGRLVPPPQPLGGSPAATGRATGGPAPVAAEAASTAAGDRSTPRLVGAIGVIAAMLVAALAGAWWWNGRRIGRRRGDLDA